MRESARAKGLRYLTEGRLWIRSVGPEGIRAWCKGNGEIYRLGFDQGAWFCDCPALSTCCHLLALQAVTVRPKELEP
jgi:hypothetical protein